MRRSLCVALIVVVGLAAAGCGAGDDGNGSDGGRVLELRGFTISEADFEANTRESLLAAANQSLCDGIVGLDADEVLDLLGADSPDEVVVPDNATPRPMQDGDPDDRRRASEIYIAECTRVRGNVTEVASQSPTEVPTGGPTEVPTPTRAPILGQSQANPYPMGQPVVLPSGFELTVTGFTNFDAWPAVKAENMFNEPPLSGARMVLIEVTLVNVDPSARVLDPDDVYYYSGLIGTRGAVYGALEVSCGVIPNDLSSADKMFPGASATGNLCVQAPIDEEGFVLVIEGRFFSIV